MKSRRILYLEDEENDVTLLRERLRADGIEAEIVHVGTPWEFSAALQGEPPGVILADGKVAGFGASAALEIARKRFPQVPFYCLTGLVTDAKAAAMRDAGATGCLSKHELGEVSQKIQDALSSTI